MLAGLAMPPLALADKAVRLSVCFLSMPSRTASAPPRMSVPVRLAAKQPV